MNELYLQDYILNQISRKYNHMHHKDHPAEKIDLLFGRVTKDYFHKTIPDIDSLIKILIKEEYVFSDYSISGFISELLRMNITKDYNDTELNKEALNKN